jgi:hypothetical protein
MGAVVVAEIAQGAQPVALQRKLRAAANDAGRVARPFRMTGTSEGDRPLRSDRHVRGALLPYIGQP